MNILVCMKQVPDTAIEVQINPQSKSVDRTNITYVVNPFEEYAIEEALRLKEKFGGEVILISMGPARAQEAIRTGLAMGADKAIHIDDEKLEGTDILGTARVLSEVIKGMEYDIVFCGKLAVDDNTGGVGPVLAELLGLPHVTAITSLEVDAEGRKAKSTREIEGGIETLEVPLPALFTAEKDLNIPRYPSLPGIMKAKTKEVKPMDLASIGIPPDAVGTSGSKTVFLGMFLPPKREAGKIIEGDVPEATKKLVKLLHEEAKVF